MELLSKESILASKDLNYEEVSVPEWSGTVRVKTMTGTERDDFEASVYETKGKDASVNFKNFRSKLVAKTLVDAAGVRLFKDSEVDQLGQKSSKALDRVFAVAQKLNGIGQKEVEELTKN